MRKLMWFVIGFVLSAVLCGYVTERSLWLPAIIISALLLAAAFICCLRWKAARIPVFLLAGMTLCFGWRLLYDGVYLAPIERADNTFAQVEFLVTEPVERTDYGIVAEGMITLEGKTYKLRLYAEADTALQLGDTLAGRFLLRSTLSGGSADNSIHRSNGIFLTAAADGDFSVTSPSKLPLRCWSAYARVQITAHLDRIFPSDTAAFARALLLGDTSLIDYATDTDLKISGIRHVVSVSGLHVTVLISLLMFLLGRRRLLMAAVVLPCLLVFAAVVGFSPSITRACLMHGLMVLAMLVNKEYDPPTALSFAVLVMLFANPLTVMHVGFQLSVGCMAGIFLFAGPIQSWLTDRNRLGRLQMKKLTAWFAGSVGISIGASITTIPLCAFYFGTVSLVSVLTNLLTLGMVSLVFYGIIAAAILGIIWLPLGVGVAWVISWGIRYVLAVAGILADLPLAAVYTDSVYIVSWLVFCYVLLVTFLLMKQKRPLGFAVCSALGLCLALLLSWSDPLQDGCRMTALDVGQGQCILLQSDGKNYLVDCGGDTDEIAADRAARLLLSQGISRLDGVIVTHFDRDHSGGVELLLQRISADAIFYPENPNFSWEYSQAITVRELQVLTFADTKITLIPSKMSTVDNESGLCILFQRENCDILITGDRSEDGERELMESIALPELEVLVAGHHGSKYSTGRELLALTTPENVIISVGADNPFGHPARQVLERLEEYGCTYYRTDENGTVIYRG